MALASEMFEAVERLASPDGGPVRIDAEYLLVIALRLTSTQPPAGEARLSCGQLSAARARLFRRREELP